MAAAAGLGLSLIGAGGGLLGAHHKNAVAAEQTSVAAADNQIRSTYADIFTRVQSGMLTEADANAEIGQAVQDYGQQTSKIRTGGTEFFADTLANPNFQGVKGKCNAGCVTWAAANYWGEDLKKKIAALAIPHATSPTSQSQVGILQKGLNFLTGNTSTQSPSQPPSITYTGMAAATPGAKYASVAGGTVPYAQSDVSQINPAIFAAFAISGVVLLVVVFRAMGKRGR